MLVCPVRLVGCFRELGQVSPEDEELPSIVEARGKLPVEHRSLVATYLRSASVYAAASGSATDCFTGERHIALNVQQTDGTWLWPASFAHYVAHHGVAVPEELLQHMRALEWRCPVLSREELLALCDKMSEFARALRKKQKRK
ncbi:hypothetical protein MYSTI_06500 [Myxococcus stipitatus DSM 14675]|uniref:Uncharacterized protein n=1 Tax=Myxococcus stipitatus (strain DSM 14675 / JCM 12634 / Mx s8) TaxID=1278073 RepID=L7UID1_MYXSD|nr:hypothetical protein [Myxococcus stipitatus]AGC47773.1 hypothetical protein MYSTI_06500 [Myxococcus stipitatus DSM 14675]